jgi:hypothetical protein
MRMHLKRKAAVQYMKDAEFPMSERSWYRWCKKLNKTMMERLYEVAQYEFPEQHLEAIEEIRTARKLMWENVHKVKDPFKQNIMVQNIINTLPLRSSYYDATKGVIEKPESKEDNTIQESEGQPAANEWV